MIRVVALKMSHLKGIAVHPKQPGNNNLALVGLLAAAVHQAWSAFDGDDLIALGGYIGPLDDGNAAWLLFTDRVMPRHFVWLVRVLKKKLEDRPKSAGPLYIDADVNYPAAKRLAELLGFAPIRNITSPDGRIMTRMMVDARLL